MGEKIIIRNDIEISVLAVGRSKVRLGITAPGNVGVHRQEVGPRPEKNGHTNGDGHAGMMEVELPLPADGKLNLSDVLRFATPTGDGTAKTEGSLVGPPG